MTKPGEEWVVRPTVAAVVEVFRERLAARLGDWPQARGPMAIALTGGGSAEPFYRGWASGYRNAGARAWDRGAVGFYWSDERLVAKNDPDSNYFLAWKTLLEPAEIPAGHVHRVPTEEPEPADRYAALIRRQIPPGPDGRPQFPIVILGLGEDGHTGSIFPGTDIYAEDESFVRRAAATPAHPHDRVTFTPALVNAAREVWFVITGAAKAQAARWLRDRRRPVEETPALLVDPKKTAITYFADSAAMP